MWWPRRKRWPANGVRDTPLRYCGRRGPARRRRNSWDDNAARRPGRAIVAAAGRQRRLVESIYRGAIGSDKRQMSARHRPGRDPEIGLSLLAQPAMRLVAGLFGGDLHHHADAQRRQGGKVEGFCRIQVRDGDTDMVQHCFTPSSSSRGNANNHGTNGQNIIRTHGHSVVRRCERQSNAQPCRYPKGRGITHRQPSLQAVQHIH